MIHDFNISHAQEQSDTLALELRPVLRNLFPQARGGRKASKFEEQRQGIDLFVEFDKFLPLTLDFKFRSKVYDDFCLEYANIGVSGRRLGWINDSTLINDLIAYVFKPIWTCWLLPRQAMQRAWKREQEKWRNEYGQGESSSGAWVTYWCAVPIEEVCREVGGIRVGDKDSARALVRDPREHYCWCGQEGSFGVGVFPQQGKEGAYYCRKHAEAGGFKWR